MLDFAHAHCLADWPDRCRPPLEHVRLSLTMKMEKLFFDKAFVFGDRRQVHGQPHAGLGSLIHADHGSGRTVIFHDFHVSPVHLVEVAHVFEKDVHVDDMV